MRLSNIPGKLVLPFANAGGKSTIPVASQIGITAGAASLTDGFPPLTRTPIAAGGVPPSGLDMNGILYEMSAIIRWANAGGGYPFDNTFATDTNVGGYPKGARIMRSDGTGYWFNTSENNVTDPEGAGAAAAGWVPDFTNGIAAVTMTSANVTLTAVQYGKPVIVITGVLTANLNLIFPAIEGQWTVINSATGAFTITAKTSGGTGAIIPQSCMGAIVGDGTDIRSLLGDIADPSNKSKGVSLVGGAGRVISSIATLRTLPKTGAPTAFVTGYYTASDGGGGEYFYDSSDTTSADNGGTIIVASDGGRWKLNQKGFVSVCQFGAKCDGSTPDQAAVQAAVNWCATFTRWPALLVPGRCLLGASVNIDRLVDTTYSEFRIIGIGDGAGFYTTDGTVMFNSTIAVTTEPKSEFVTFENIHFETSSIFNESYVLSKKFLRCKFLNCNFRLIRCILSTIYVQTLHFSNCNIRNNAASFVNSVGLYDVEFDECIIENGSTLVRSVDTVRGTNGLRIIGGVIEGIQASIVVATGVNAFNLIGAHLESNFSPEFNLWGGNVNNGSITVTGNYIYNPAGATFYYGPTANVFSAGNTAFPSVLHSNMVQVVSLVSMGDTCSGGISDATIHSLVNGVYRAGNVEDVWTHTAKHITKSAAGEFGFGWTPLAGIRATFFGQDQSNTKYAAGFYDSSGNAIITMRNDRQLFAPALATNTGTALVLDASGYIKKLSSSRRYKRNIKPTELGLEFIKKLNPVEYDRTDYDASEVGFIAEDFPDSRFIGMSRVDPEDAEKGLQIESVNYAPLVAPLVKAVQELSAQVDALSKKPKTK